MSDNVQEVAEAAQSILGDHADHDHDKDWDAGTWAALETAGLTSVVLPESLGGGGGSLAEAAEIVRAVGANAARIPAAEATLVAPWLLELAGVPLPTGSMSVLATYGRVSARNLGEDRFELDGIAEHVAYGRVVDHVVVLARSDAGPVVAVVESAQVQIHPGENLAGEPADDLDLSGVVCAAVAVPPETVDGLGLRTALGRLLLTSGAVQQILALTVRYVQEREQFGRAIGRLQVVQHLVAELAGEAAAIQIGTDAALLALSSQAPTSWLAVASAKIDADAASTRIARIAHQLHGAIGATHEHPLRRYTLRIWSWRGDGGRADEWAQDLAERVLDPSSPGLWQQIVGN